jgi:hypothetical protein
MPRSLFDAFKETDQNQPEVHARNQRWPANAGGVVPFALLFAEPVEACLFQLGAQLCIAPLCTPAVAPLVTKLLYVQILDLSDCS